MPWASVSALLLAAGLAGCSRPQAQPEPVRAVRLLTVGQGSAAASQEFAAEVKARTESRLSFRVGGKLLERRAELGDSVKAGQLLARIDPTDLQLGQEAAQAALRAAQANLDQVAADLKRARELFAQNFVGAAEVERRDTAVKAAQAQLEQARAQAGVQGNQAQYARLLADVSGVVTAVEAEPGAVLGAGTPVLRLAHDGPRDVVFSIPEDRVAPLRALRGKPGAIQVTLWSVAGSGRPQHPDLPCQGGCRPRRGAPGADRHRAGGRCVARGGGAAAAVGADRTGRAQRGLAARSPGDDGAAPPGAGGRRGWPAGAGLRRPGGGRAGGDRRGACAGTGPEGQALPGAAQRQHAGCADGRR